MYPSTTGSFSTAIGYVAPLEACVEWCLFVSSCSLFKWSFAMWKADFVRTDSCCKVIQTFGRLKNWFYCVRAAVFLKDGEALSKFSLFGTKINILYEYKVGDALEPFTVCYSVLWECKTTLLLLTSMVMSHYCDCITERRRKAKRCFATRFPYCRLHP